MDEKTAEEGLKEGRIFRILDSFYFAAQVPDSSIGCSGSRCSNCGCGAAFIDQLCPSCGIPFVGPSGFPPYYEWREMSVNRRLALAHDIYRSPSKGRLGYARTPYIPLTPMELRVIETLGFDQSRLFEAAFHIAPRDIRGTLHRFVP